MSIVITTKFYGPTDTKGARIGVRAGSFSIKFYPYDYALNGPRNHFRAAAARYADLFKAYFDPNAEAATFIECNPVGDVRYWIANHNLVIWDAATGKPIDPTDSDYVAP